MQESKSTGLGASFGGDSSDSLFGTSTAEVLKKITGCFITAFMIMALFLSLWTSVIGRKKSNLDLYDERPELTQVVNIEV